jgi:hypothetical protein
LLGRAAPAERHAETTVALYVASQVDARRVGMHWPAQLNSDTLLDRLRTDLDPERFGRLWADGQQLTIEAVARQRGLLDSAA